MIYYVEDDDNIRGLTLYALRQQGIEAEGFASDSEFKLPLRVASPMRFCSTSCCPTPMASRSCGACAPTRPPRRFPS